MVVIIFERVSVSLRGDLTRWMAVPWQTDTSSCRAGYVPQVDPYLPTFWPARVPNQVLTLQSYATVLDRTASLERRQAAFRERTEWLRVPALRASQALPFVNRFIAEWSSYGVITRQPGPADTAFPDEFWVEIGYDRDGG